MSKTLMINMRIEPQLKQSVEEVLAKLGLTTTDAVRLFLNQVILHRGLPFDVKVPNVTTRKAMREARSKKGGKIHRDFADYLAKNP